jgi:hypothetical protein
MVLETTNARPIWVNLTCGETLCEKAAADLVVLKTKVIQAKLAFERAEIAFTDATDGWRKSS